VSQRSVLVSTAFVIGVTSWSQFGQIIDGPPVDYRLSSVRDRARILSSKAPDDVLSVGCAVAFLLSPQ
jgi:hypothetical protein